MSGFMPRLAPCGTKYETQPWDKPADPVSAAASLLAKQPDKPKAPAKKAAAKKGAAK